MDLISFVGVVEVNLVRRASGELLAGCFNVVHEVILNFT